MSSTAPIVNLPRDPESGAFFCHVAARLFVVYARQLLGKPPKAMPTDPFAAAWDGLEPSGRRLLVKAAGLGQELAYMRSPLLEPPELDSLRQAAQRLHEWSGRLLGRAA